jgi:hypothetical protein
MRGPSTGRTVSGSETDLLVHAMPGPVAAGDRRADAGVAVLGDLRPPRAAIRTRVHIGDVVDDPRVVR